MITLFSRTMMRHLPLMRENDFRPRILLAILLALNGIVFVVTAYFIGAVEHQMDAETRHWSLILLVTVQVVLLFLTAALLRGAYHLANVGTVGVALGAIGLALFLTEGAPYSPALPLCVVPPLLAYCLLGARIGLLIAVAVPLCLAVQWFGADAWNWQLPALQSRKNPLLDTVLTNAVGYVFVIAITVVYERMNGKLRVERDRERARLAHLATHDELTGLANRRYFRQRLDQACQSCDRNGVGLAVLLIDLDGFKPVNDRLGHATGDQVLIATGLRLRSLLRCGDLVARLGGDEFAIMVYPNPGAVEVEHLCQRIRLAINEPIAVGGCEIILDASIGAALYPGLTHQWNVDHVLNHADAEMYAVKRQRRGQPSTSAA